MNCLVDILNALQVNQAIYVIFCCKTGDELLFVLVHPASKIIGYPGIEYPGKALENVDVILFCH